MIKPIILILASMVCLALLDQSNGMETLANQPQARRCNSFLFECYGLQHGVEKMFASICVDFELRHFQCKPELTLDERGIKCTQQVASRK